ncbi:MAG: helix-turn-helix domain-containing protein [Actinobacteria bacterium]|nr:helix-turn-helix domain-containing protein [Actinomycetota bacterium]
MSIEERETISQGLARKLTLTAIATELGWSVSTVSREVRRNSGPNGYRAGRAERLAVAPTARPRAGKLADDPVLRRYVEDKLALSWSPRQISRRCCVSTSRRRPTSPSTPRSNSKPSSTSSTIDPGTH